MTQHEWLKLGWEKGWCGPALCLPHDGFPLSADEDDVYNEGGDDCLHFVRLYWDNNHRLAVEANDSPTNWRATNMGFSRGQ